MGSRDPRVDAYIARSADFARPILIYLRDRVHEHCPQVEESIKWGSPHFLYRGMLCNMAAFKQHCTFGFWRGALFVDDASHGQAMGQFGRITSLDEAPGGQRLGDYIRGAMALNESGTQHRRPAGDVKSRPADEIPADLAAALENDTRAAAVFDAFSPSHRREYIEWISEAKRAQTRAKRLAQTLEWLAQGKPRNWKYQSR